ncbi:C10 family peptidase [Prevotella melaninogenica]|uniref:C10 family peptidase n=1 Tax=Prevotella TaxID=838 RepID=UPI00056951B1|nr:MULTISPECIES: C10 family peptidase [Prevotella]QUB74651.1 C10 family peptidase [Prevotella melaninogenica]
MNFRKRLFLKLLFTFTAALTITAAPRPKAVIKAVAAKVFRQSPSLSMTRASGEEPRTLLANKAFTVMGYNNGGFVIVSNDDLLPAVIAYSNTVFDKNTSNTGFKWYLSAVEEAINGIVKAGKPRTMIAPDQSKYAAKIPSFVTSIWGQEKPYNNLCPEGTTSGTGSWQGYGSTGRTVTGCVATAMAQIMYYNRWPEKGTGGTHSVYVKQANGTKKIVTVNYEESFYDYANMIDSYKGHYSKEQGDAVAKLMLDCGVAADMNYATDGSGTYTENAARGLRRNFGYPETTQMLKRRRYSEQAWMDIIYNEINERRAILYTGVDNKNGGHAFVLSGYDETGKVWINWGWDGASDGFYDIALLNPKSYKFSEDQDMIIGIEGEKTETIQDTITVDTPGRLQELIADSIKSKISSLKINGKINSTDLRTIRQIAGNNPDGTIQRSSLVSLDLSDAVIVSGGDPYLVDDKRQLTTNDNEIPERAFFNCKSIRKLILPKSTMTIGDGAFGKLGRLDSISIPTGDDKNYIFDGQTLMTKDSKEIIAVMPNNKGDFNVAKGITKIHNYGFSGCSKLTKIVLPNTITTIGDEVFSGNNSLGIIRLYSKEVPVLGHNAFTDISKSEIKLQIPSGTKNHYKRNAQWKDFDIVEFGTTIKARNMIRTYGSENPKLGWQLKGDYVEGTPELSCEATKTSPVGKYTIVVKRGTITEEQVEFANGFLIVKKATAKMHAKDVTIEVGQTPSFGYTVDELQNNETTVALEKEPTFTITDSKGKKVTEYNVPGKYTITVSDAEAENYKFEYSTAVLTITLSPNGILNTPQTASTVTFDVYSLNGTCIAKGVSSLKGLSKGVYLVNGKKLIIK